MTTTDGLNETWKSESGKAAMEVDFLVESAFSRGGKLFELLAFQRI
jgi:hypothetical protein